MSEVEFFIYYAKKVLEFPVVKFIAGLILFLLNTLLGDIFAPAIVAILVLWLLDFVTGFWYARANPIIKPTSRRFRAGWYKLGFYLILLAAGHQCSFINFGFLNDLVKPGINGLIQGGLAFTEVFSIAENVDNLTTLKGFKIKFIHDFLTFLQGKYNRAMEIASNREGESNGPTI